MIEQASRSCARGIQGARKRAPINCLFVERAIESPPDQFKNLFEVDRRSRRGRHSARERRIEMSMGADHSRHYEFPRQVGYFVLVTQRQFGGPIDNKASIDAEVRTLD